MNERLVLELEQMSKQHSDNLEVALETFELTRREATRMLMKGEEIPMEVYGQICCLDSVNKIINKINYRNTNKETWVLEDYIDSLFDYIQDYIKDNKLNIKTIISNSRFMELDKEYDDNLLLFIISAALRYNDSFIHASKEK